MRRTAKMFMKDRSSAVRLPNSFQSSTAEVLIPQARERRDPSGRGPATGLSTWTLPELPPSSFMEGVEDLPVQERTILEYCRR